MGGWRDRLRSGLTDRKRLEGVLGPALLCLVLGLWQDRMEPLWIAAALLALGLLSRTAALWVARAWGGLTGLVGRVATAILLVLVFYLLLTPLGLLARLLRRVDPELVGRGRGTPALTVREHRYGPEDFDLPG